MSFSRTAVESAVFVEKERGPLLLTNQPVVLWYSVLHRSACQKIFSPASVGSVGCPQTPPRER